ncbi:MAG: NAD-dependent epimerase/dehydratase family protein [Candidatus Parvarchaeota archaeon]|nr:NAD-dependent epimerase/dehydratase family protein [Candidatus Jingweiarchaeum tengchongense]
MRTILVTGSNGFIGRNLIQNLSRNESNKIITFGRNNSLEDLKSFLGETDFVYHLAAVNRTNDETDFETVNVGLTQKIVDFLITMNKKVNIVMASSVQALADNPYGKSKKAAEDILKDYSDKMKTSVYIYRLPNVFGKWGKPNYNSVVSTFCYNTTHGKDIWISDENKEIELVYIDDVVKEFVRVLNSEDIGQSQIMNVKPTFKVTLGKLAQMITNFHENRKQSIVPDFSDEFVKRLYPTYLSYLDKNDLSQTPELKTDERGSLFELVRSKQFGQIFISTTKPGYIRGNHYHDSKIEKFCLIKGAAIIMLRNLLTNESVSYHVSDQKIEIVDIPPGYTHSIQNVGNEEMIVLFWSDEIFDPQRSDTYYKRVEDE